MKNLKNIFGFLLIISIFACSHNADRDKKEPRSDNCDIVAAESATVHEPFAPPPPPAMESTQFSPPAVEYDKSEETGDERYLSGNSNDTKSISAKVSSDKKKIIKDGNMSIKAKDVASSKKNMDAILKKYNAYYDLEEYGNNDQSIYYSLKLRIPSGNFESLLAAIEGGGDEITNKTINTHDVTEEYTDTETRLANKREYLKRYKDILLRAGTIKDVLEVEENIRVLEEEIESKEGRLKYLSDQVEYSTLDINLYHEKEYVYKPQEEDKFSERVKKSLSNGWSAIVDFTVAFIGIWPVILMVIAAVFAARRVIKKRRAKSTN